MVAALRKGHIRITPGQARAIRDGWRKDAVIHTKEPRLTHHARTLLVVVAIVAAVLATLSAEGGDIILTALGWLGVAVAALAAGHLP